MRFLVRDLMITVLPLLEAAPKGCGNGPPTGCEGCSFMTPEWTRVPLFCTPGCQTEQIASLEDLVSLRQALRQRLTEVEATERIRREALQPKSADEVNLLSRYLTEALDELRELSERTGDGGSRQRSAKADESDGSVPE